MGQYYYCLVRPKNMDTVYWYLADEDVKINSFVEIPFGRENRLRYGVVEEANKPICLFHWNGQKKLPA